MASKQQTDMTYFFTDDSSMDYKTAFEYKKQEEF